MHQGHTSPPAPRIEEACRRFERAWQAGERPRIEDFLGALPCEEQPALLRALLALELTHRRQAGEAVAYDECLQRFPDHAELVRELLGKRDIMPSAQLFGSSVSVAPDQAATAAAAQPPSDLPVRLGRYRITALLGKGGFGIVYKGHDDELNREVAIKVPHRQRVARPEDVEAYVREARLLASLEHAHIVPVYDVGRTEDGLCFVVSKFIGDGDLHGRLLAGRLAVREAAELAATVAEALHHAHRRGLIHRDVKPANILLTEGKPFLADFGLALREEDFGKGAGYAGTPAYMSPEQARGEGHRVDGRSDVFSLGVVFYEMLTGRRPFRGDTVSEILDRIVTAEAQPPRQLDDTIPRELERICLKALAKKASERYTTALDFAEDLRHWLAPPVGQASRLPDTPGKRDACPTGAVRVVPKGLRSFDAGDADFFLELLPGPRDREGLPDSLRFWKGRIEEPDPDKTFAVGLLYGPSGCGKSSLVKAGLLPRLAGHILAVHIEATAEETETRLLKALRKRCPALGDRLGLVDTLAALRRGQGLAPGQKVLVVLDQFEQWLHARRHEQDTELVRALRHCDGGRVQAVVLVRDDFWLAVSRFMTDLEIDIRQGDNAALVDLFDPLHARKVLAEFGRAFGRLPEDLAALSREQAEFLDQAVSGLAQDGKVISVRLALFAEMVKGKPWQPATLRAVGGTEGVGVAFLEETFSASTANPRHRLHQRAARAVLKALLPERGSDIKGNMRSEQELLELSGCGGRPRDFAELLRILDADLRLITPTDPEGATEDSPARSASKGETGPLLALRAGRCYQLTHDYLVPSLREWLTRKQKETRRGRAELRLAERAALWNSKPHNRHLPAWWEWLNIRLFTHKKDWTPPQRQMMRKARRYHAVRGTALAVMLVLLSVIGLVIRGRVVEENRATHAAGLVQSLLNADPAQVHAIVAELDDYRTWADPLLRQEYDQAAPHSREKLYTALALLPVDAGQRDYLRDRLLDATPQEVPVIVQALKPHGPALQDGLWRIAEKPPADQEAQRLRAAAALAAFDPGNPRWGRIAAPVVKQLVAENPLHLGQWLEGFRAVKGRLLAPLGVVFRDRKDERTSERATILLADYAAGLPDTLADLLMDADDRQFPVLFPKLRAHGERGLAPLLAELDRRPQPPFDTSALDDAWESIPAKAQAARERLAKRQANAAVALLRLGRPERVWPLLKHQSDPRVPLYLIHRLSPLGADPHSLWRRFEAEADVSAKRALLLCLGEFSEKELPLTERAKLLPRLLELYRNDPDPGLHGAAAWLLGQWGQRAKLRELDDKELAGRDKDTASRGRQPPDGRRWYVNGQGQTMVLISGPVVFRMGSPRTEAEREGGAGGRVEQPHYRRIGRSFAIAAHEVTVEQFLQFRKGYQYDKVYARTPDCPINTVSWYEAAEYCNWLSKQEGIRPDQWCYLPNAADKFAEGMKIKPNYLELTGYRLPTEAEWEYACRAGAVTARSFGETDELLPHYAWFTKNSGNRWLLPVGTLKPNDLGLFDMLGNDYEWCQDPFLLYPTGTRTNPSEDKGYNRDIQDIKDGFSPLLRGGAFSVISRLVRSADRSAARPSNANNDFGLRPARTFR